MARFLKFKEGGLAKIASSLGYTGNMSGFKDYLEKNPNLKSRMKQLENSAIEMASKAKSSSYQQTQAQPEGTIGQFVPPPKQEFDTIKMQAGGTLVPLPGPNLTKNETTGSKVGSIGQQMVRRALNPAIPTGGKVDVAGIQQSTGQFIPQGTGQVGSQPSAQTSTAGIAQAQPIQTTDANLITDVEKSGEKVDAALNAVQAAQTDPNDPRAKVVAAEQTKSAVSDLNAAQGSAIKMDNPVQREIQQGELIDGVANAEKAAKFTEQIQAAETQPSEKATVQGQLASLTANFDATNPPAWAAGALRGVQAAMAQRGLGASSMAGQAMIQAAIESALPIASADAQTQASFEAQNLSNRQARAMLAAEQRASFMGQEFDQAFQARVQNAGKISDVANMNFTAEQQIALENSRAANTVNLNNLSNSQAMVMAEASALANLDMSNLNNRQQAAVQNAQSFLQMDMANLSNKQATTIFKAQQTVQSLFTDQAQENAARQFNATSQNQTDQFFSNLKSQTSQFNASQANAQIQFNAGEANAMAKFNKEIANQRDQFNANNQLAIAQSNAVWRREIATADTAAVNRANELNASAVLDISKTAYDNLWSYYSDTMEYAWKAADNELDRMNNLAIAQLSAEATKAAAAAQASSAAGSALGGLLGTIGSAFIEFG
jgi:hypothetical protein